MKKKILYKNAKIFTSDKEQLFANAMIIEDEKIIWIGDFDKLSDEDKALPCKNLQNKRVLPAFIDSHNHPIFASYLNNQVCALPPNVNSIKELIVKMKENIKVTDTLVESWGYDESKFEEKRMPNRYDLDKVSKDLPVIATRACVHIISVNSKVLQIAGITKDTPNPQGGEIEKDEFGEPTGVLKETGARELVFSKMPQKSLDEIATNMKVLGDFLLSYGITGLAEMYAKTYPFLYIDIYRRAKELGYKQRTYIYQDWTEWMQNPPKIDPKDTKGDIKLIGIKIIGDGSVSGRTAWTNEHYVGDEKAFGFPTANMDVYESAYKFAKENNLKISSHAMGDKTIDRAVDFFKDKKPWTKIPSVTIEHITMLNQRHINECKKANIAFNTQPIFLYAEIESYTKNLGEQRTNQTYKIKDILQNNVLLALSSDAPATAWYDFYNPFIGLQAAVTRTSHNGYVHGKEQCISLEDAIICYTKNAALVLGDDRVGVLKSGYEADFIVLDKDIFSIGKENIINTKVLQTYQKGKLVYERSEDE